MHIRSSQLVDDIADVRQGLRTGDNDRFLRNWHEVDSKKIQLEEHLDKSLIRHAKLKGITGDRMPQGSPPLSDAQIKLVRDWIRRGAPND